MTNNGTKGKVLISYYVLSFFMEKFFEKHKKNIEPLFIPLNECLNMYLEKRVPNFGEVLEVISGSTGHEVVFTKGSRRGIKNERKILYLAVL